MGKKKSTKIDQLIAKYESLIVLAKADGNGRRVKALSEILKKLKKGIN